MTELYCRECGKTFSRESGVWRCSCGGFLSLRSEARFLKDRIMARPATIWRYAEALPVAPEEAVTLGEPVTPLVPVSRPELGAPVASKASRTASRLYLKLEYLFPTGSFKDRGAAVMVTHMKAIGIPEAVEDSSGNAGAAVAAYCARAGIKCRIYVPAGTSSGKLAQIHAYGAAVVEVPGSREETARATLAAAKTTYYASHSLNPFFFEGTKTFAFEVWEQLGWAAPDALIMPAGNGTLLLGAYIGFKELLAARQIEKLPRIIAVQAAACPPIERAFRRGLDHVPAVDKGETLGEGISVARPVRGPEILAAIRETGGAAITVPENEIKDALHSLCRSGYFVEPTSAVAWAGYLEARESGLLPDGVTVLPLTGSGLKAGEKMLKRLPYLPSKPSLSSGRGLVGVVPTETVQ